MRLLPLIFGELHVKRLARLNVSVRFSATAHGSPSPSTSSGYASTSSMNRNRTGIERRPGPLFAPATTRYPPAKSFISTVLAESRLFASLNRLASAGVSSIIGCSRWRLIRLPVSVVGITSISGPGARSTT